MSIEKKLSQLNELSEFQPDNKWKATTKYEVLDEIASQNRLRKALALTSAEKLDLFFMRAMRRTVPSATKVIAGFLVVMLGSGVGFAAQASVPGETLWPIKRSIEKAELTLTISPVKETEVHIKHVNKRLDEIDKILTNAKNDTHDEKAKAIKQAVSHLEKDVKAADTTLKVVKEEKRATETVSLAKKVKDVARETKAKAKVLKDESTKTSPDQEIENALEEVEKVSSETEKSVLNLAVALHEEVVAKKASADAGDPEAKGTSTDNGLLEDAEIEVVKQVVTEILASEIEDLTSEITVSKDKVNKASETNTMEASTDTESATSTAELKITLDETKVDLEEAEVQLSEAKTLLENGELKEVLSKVVKSKDLSQSAETVVKKIDATNASNEAENNTDTTTTTDDLINMETDTSTPPFIEKSTVTPVEASGMELITETEIKEETADEVQN